MRRVGIVLTIFILVIVVAAAVSLQLRSMSTNIEGNDSIATAETARTAGAPWRYVP
jgi:hypothetical protein